jgi:hypothetical protein
MNSSHCSHTDLRQSIHDFVVAGRSDELTEEMWADFEQRLRESDDACRLYADYAGISAILPSVLSSMPDEGSLSPDVFPLGQQGAAVLFAPGLLAGAWHGTVNYFSSGWPVAYLIATMAVGIGLWIGSLVPAFHPQQIAKRSSSTPRIESAPERRRELVGRVTAMADCRWASDAVPLPVNDGVPVGREIKLESGLMEITYDSGAKVILQGPATYEVESADGGYLSVGKLTAKVDKGSGMRDKSSDIPHPSALIPHPLFVVRTPTATITDLGTEFGVEVGKAGDCDVRVFDGEVQIASSLGGNDAAASRRLTAGQIVRIDRSGIRPVPASELRSFAVVRKGFLPRGFCYDFDCRIKEGLVLKGGAFVCIDPRLGPTQRLRLMQNGPWQQQGAAWCATKHAVAKGFSTEFQFQFSFPEGLEREGLAFVLQNAAEGRDVTAGERGLAKNALNVVIGSDGNDDGSGDPSIVVRDGDKTLAMVDLKDRFGRASLGDSVIHTARIDYTPGSLNVRLNGVPVLENVRVDLAKLRNGSAMGADGKAWIGFTVHTEHAAENHDVLTWRFYPKTVNGSLLGLTPHKAAHASGVSSRSIHYHFANDAEGWTSLDLGNPPSGEPWRWSVGVAPPISNNIRDSATDAGVRGGGDKYVYPGVRSMEHPCPQDQPHSTRIFRSPEFQLAAAGDITLYLSAGVGGASAPPANGAGLQKASSSTGFLGVALRDVATGNYVASTRRTVRGGCGWEFRIMDLSQVDRSKTYTLDLIDACDGSWAWITLDEVVIPVKRASGRGDSRAASHDQDGGL